jgi:hypothetical protein
VRAGDYCHTRVVEEELRFALGAENGEADARDEKKNREGERHFRSFLVREVGLHRAEFGDFFGGVVCEARMDQTDNAGEHQEDAEHQDESLHGLKPYHKLGKSESRQEPETISRSDSVPRPGFVETGPGDTLCDFAFAIEKGKNPWAFGAQGLFDQR